MDLAILPPSSLHIIILIYYYKSTYVYVYCEHTSMTDCIDKRPDVYQIVHEHCPADNEKHKGVHAYHSYLHIYLYIHIYI